MMDDMPLSPFFNFKSNDIDAFLKPSEPTESADAAYTDVCGSDLQEQNLQAIRQDYLWEDVAASETIKTDPPGSSPGDLLGEHFIFQFIRSNTASLTLQFLLDTKSACHTCIFYAWDLEAEK